jgi:hypothetical protein
MTIHQTFAEELETLEALQLIEQRRDRYALTDKGVRHRDVIVQLFFSDRIANLVNGYHYND